MKRISILALLAAAVLSACGDDDDPIGPTPASSYTADVSGDLTAALTGSAFFGSDTDEQGEPVFAILLADSTAEHVVVLGYPGTTLPAKGTYELENLLENEVDGWTVLHTVGEGEELVAMFMATSGEIVITESSADRMKGTFEYEGLAILGAEPGEEPIEITVEGTFDAEPATGDASLAVATAQSKF